MTGLLLICLLCLISGVYCESRLSLDNLLERVLVVFTLAAAQLLLAIQCLSLMTWLTGAGLIAANALLTLLSVGLSRFWPPTDQRPSWKILLTNTWQEFAAQRKETLVLLLLAVALVSMVVHCSLGAWMVPIGDSYHIEMPLYWIQNHSIAHFPIENPRVNSTAFAGEALTLPGYMYFHSSVMLVVISFGAGILSLGIVFSLARKMGCSIAASLGAAAVTTGFTDFALTFLTVTNGNYLAGMWAGASLWFLINSRPSENFSKPQLTRLGCSIFCFLMACGAKNTVPLLAPLYLIALVVTLRSFLFQSLAVLTLISCGGMALVCSGVLWSYVSNQLWYGNVRGPEFMQNHITREFAFKPAWTRLSRGAVLMVFDTIWVPKSAQKTYADLCGKAVRLLGGQEQLDEDEVFYNFDENTRTPLKGCGLAGIVFLLPGIAVGLKRCLEKKRFAVDQTASARLNLCLVLLFAIGSFAVCHAALHWQSIGLLRLMPVFSVVSAPLCALLLEKTWLRAVALGLLLLSTVMFLTYDLSMVGRRLGGADGNILFRMITRLEKNHSVTFEYQWQDRAPQKLQVHEDYTTREICQEFLEGITQPTVIGFVGGVNSDARWLFGRGWRNKIIPLVDDRNPDKLLEPPKDVEYLVFSGSNYSDPREWALQHDYSPLFRVVGDHCVFVALKKNAVDNQQ
jgi:hypothetical protein